MSTMMEYQTKAGDFRSPITSGSSPIVMTPNQLQKENVINLASGFCAFHNNGFLEIEPNDSQSDEAKALTLSKTMPLVTYGLSYSPKTTTLFKMYDMDSTVIRNFEFREELFIDFKRNLGHPNLRLLLEAQLYNDFLTPSHVTYLQETLDLLSGFIDRRRISNESWSTILYHYKGDFVKGQRDLKVLLNKNKYPVTDISVEMLISLWVSTAPSTSDLVWFDHLIWGKTPLGRIQ